jgi:hypothetical protein
MLRSWEWSPAYLGSDHRLPPIYLFEGRRRTSPRRRPSLRPERHAIGFAPDEQVFGRTPTRDDGIEWTSRSIME